MNEMMNTIKTGTMNEILHLQRRIDSGEIETLIAQRIAKIKQEQPKQCPVCGTSVDPSTSLKLEYGVCLRRQAYFDAKDCLIHFSQNNINDSIQ